jgi:hypothetical protein
MRRPSFGGRRSSPAAASRRDESTSPPGHSHSQDDLRLKCRFRQFYAALKATGQFELVADPGEADMVLELQLIAPNGPSEGSKQKGASEPLPMFRLVVYDRKTRYALWTLTRSIQIAYLQKTHDRNFDSALSALLLDFETLTSKAPTAAH